MCPAESELDKPSYLCVQSLITLGIHYAKPCDRPLRTVIDSHVEIDMRYHQQGADDVACVQSAVHPMKAAW
jgi:hypothetical protein